MTYGINYDQNTILIIPNQKEYNKLIETVKDNC